MYRMTVKFCLLIIKTVQQPTPIQDLHLPLNTEICLSQYDKDLMAVVQPWLYCMAEIYVIKSPLSQEPIQALVNEFYYYDMIVMYESTN